MSGVYFICEWSGSRAFRMGQQKAIITSEIPQSARIVEADQIMVTDLCGSLKTHLAKSKSGKLHNAVLEAFKLFSAAAK